MKNGSENFTENFKIISIFHWVFALSVLLLLASGFHISFPRVEADWPMSRTRLIHLVMSSVLVFSLIFRIYYSLVKRTYSNFIIRKKDFKTIIPLFKNFFFIKGEPRSLLPKYDIGQKFFFLSWALGVFLQTITGLVMLTPGRFTFLVNLLRDLQTIRYFHFLIALWFLLSVSIHIYLTLTEDPLRVLALLTGKDLPAEKIRNSKPCLLIVFNKFKKIFKFNIR